MDKRIGAQLYTLRDFAQTKEDLEKTFIKLKEIGYKAVQLSGIGNIPAKDVKELCDKYEMIPACTHRGWDEYLNNIDFTVDYHKTIGCTIPGLGALPALWTDTTKEIMIDSIEKMNSFTETLKEHGMTFVYHNHTAEFQKIDGKYIMDYMIEMGTFDFVVDVYWVAVAGINPAEFIRKLGKRAKVIHFKDLEMYKNDHRMAEVMEGNLDWDSIIATCEEAGAEWAMVEQDVCQRDPFESLTISYNNLKTKGFN